MTRKMKAAVLSAPGGPEALEIKDVEIPWPASDNQVLVRLQAAALNPADAYFRAFGPYINDARPCILGHDGAGIVEEIGNAVSRFQPGQRVCFCNGGLGGDFGSYAEFAVVPDSQLALVPDKVDIATAVALDNIGPEGLQKTFSAMAPYGRVVTLMGTPGDDAEETAYVKNLTIHNVMMLTPMLLGLQTRLDQQAKLVTQVLDLIAAGKLHVAIDKVFPLRDISDAHARLDAGGVTGKIVISISD